MADHLAPVAGAVGFAGPDIEAVGDGLGVEDLAEFAGGGAKASSSPTARVMSRRRRAARRAGSASLARKWGGVWK